MLENRNLTVMFTDIKGFTQRTSQQTRAELMDLLDRHREIVLPVAERHGGKLIKTIGDAFLVTFESPTNGVLAGVRIQEALRDYNKSAAGDQRIEIRIAVNSGEVTVTDGDVYGEPVNIASRIEGIAEPGEVYFTEAVYLSMNKREVPSSEIGYRHLKGIPEKIKVFKVLQEVPPGELEAGEATAAPAATASPAAAPVLPEPDLGDGDDGLRTRKLPNTSAPDVPLASIPQRGLAVFIDVLVFALLIGNIVDWLIPEQTVTIPLGGKDGVQVEGLPTEVSVENGVLKVKGENGEEVEIGADGVKVLSDGEKVEVGAGGVRVGAASKADDTDHDAGRDDHEAGEHGHEAGEHEHAAGDEITGTITYDTSDNFPVKFGLWLLWMALFWGFWGATPGQLALGLQVVRSSDGEKPEIPRALLRAGFWAVAFVPLGLGFIAASWDARRQGWHDRAAKTLVVKPPHD